MDSALGPLTSINYQRRQQLMFRKPTRLKAVLTSPIGESETPHERRQKEVSAAPTPQSGYLCHASCSE
jgi:hypothetical protein